MKKFAVCLLFLLTATVVPAANAIIMALIEAHLAYSRGDYEIAFKEYKFGSNPIKVPNVL